MTETLKERKRKEREKKIQEARKRQRVRIALFFAGLFLVALVIFFFLSSEVFKVKQVAVSKTSHASLVRIEKAKKMLIGKNIFRAPVTDVRELLLKDTWIKSAEITRRYPDRIDINIVERKPLAQVSEDGIFYLVSVDGMILEKRLESSDLIEIADLPLKKLKVGSYLKSSEFKEAMKVYKSLDSDLKKQVLVISAPSEDKLIFYIGGTEVIYGQAEYMDKKNQIIKEILRKEGKKAISIDIRVPDNPIVKEQP
ncbi:MAG: FtsQ-type POTRA domain-containing protein [Actinobacteria bacterium]|nr:FtsQ-type POTRA domain-containing protein [Actinomycetota bacterium]